MGTLISYKGNTIENQYPEIPSFTQEEWDSLSENEKKQYNLIYIQDDQAEGGQIVVDEVTEGNYNSVSSNAVAELFNSDKYLHNSTGYEILPSGLIIQWGYSSIGEVQNDNWRVTFPISFPNNCLKVIGQPESNLGIGASYTYVVSLTKTGCSFYVLGGAPRAGISYIAIGY